MSTSGVTGGWIWAILTCSKRENPQACLTRGSYAGYHTRWRGLESYLLKEQSRSSVSNVTSADVSVTTTLGRGQFYDVIGSRHEFLLKPGTDLPPEIVQ